MNPLASGAVGGLVATVPMTVTMNRLHRRLPRRERYPLPPHIITERAANMGGLGNKLTNREQHGLTLLSHYGYGTAAGSLFGFLAPRDRGTAVFAGVGYGLLVWAGSYLGLLPAIGILTPATRHPPRRTALMIVAHVVWGATLGLLASTLLSRGTRD